MKTSRYAHLGLSEWPFVTVPEPSFCTFLADRAMFTVEVEGIILHLLRRNPSSIHIFWAWFGTGKTHTLHYLTNRGRKMSLNAMYNELVIVYTEFPRTIRSFLDLFRAFTSSLDIDLLANAFLEVCTCASSEKLLREMELASTDFTVFLRVIATGAKRDQITAMRWLRAEDLPITEFRSIGIGQKINNSEKASRILPAIVKLLNAAAEARKRPGCRVMWLLDEFQRIELFGRGLINEINAGLHSLFNACPVGFSLFLSFSGKPSTRLPDWFSPELRDRIGITKVMILPPMQETEALIFVQDLLARFRLPEYSDRDTLFPFSRSACEAIFEAIRKAGDIKPRSLMQAFNAILEEADPAIEQGQMTVISPDFARKVLSERVVLTNENEELHR